MSRTRLDSSELLSLRFGNRSRDSIGEQFLVAHDRCERSAQLVRHHRKKITLRPVSAFRLGARCLGLRHRHLGFSSRFFRCFVCFTLEHEKLAALTIDIA